MNRIPINIDEYPRCGRCEMPVEDFYAVELENSLELVVECHQAIERVSITAESLKVIQIGSVAITSAFDKTEAQESD